MDLESLAGSLVLNSEYFSIVKQNCLPARASQCAAAAPTSGRVTVAGVFKCSSMCVEEGAGRFGVRISCHTWEHFA